MSSSAGVSSLSLESLGSPVRESDVLGVPYERVAMIFFDSHGVLGGKMVALCAEPRMGRHDVITGVLATASRQGAKILRRDLSSCGPEEATTFLTRLARQVARRSELVAIGIDEIPASDEGQVMRQARALKRIWETGSSIIFSIAPEASQLLENLPECLVATSSDLIAQSLAEGPSDALRLTRGIPSLVRALWATPGALSKNGTLPSPTPVYYDALGSLFSSALRSSLPDEERRLRLAMLLLGRGSADDLERVLGLHVSELLDGVRINAPLFGISTDLLRFTCLSDESERAYSTCLRSVEACSALFPDLVPACMNLLADSARYDRASELCRLPESRGAYGMILDRGAEFLDAGEVVLVRRVISSPASPANEGVPALCAAADALSSRRARKTDRAATFAPEPNVALGFVNARLFLKGREPAFEAGRDVANGLGRRLALHERVCSLMVRGLFSAALQLLVTVPREEKGHSVSSALLALDYEVARLMTGGGPGEGASFAAEASKLLGSQSLRGLGGYVSIVRAIREVMGAESKSVARVEGINEGAERSGEVLVQIVGLIAGCISDLRQGAVARANIRASLAQTLAEGAGLDYLGRVAELLGNVVEFHVGTRSDQADLDELRDDLSVAGRLVQSALLSDEASLSAIEMPEEIPWDALWLLRVLGDGMGDFSELLRERMPPRWRRMLAVGEGHGPSAPTGLPLPPLVGEASAVSMDVPPLELSLLGSFSLHVRGIRVADWKLERRNAKSMLEYLVLRHGAGMKRFQLVEQVWPGCDYATGFNRAYQATSSLRAIIAEIDQGLDPFTANRTSKEISLNMDLVRCDVNVFRECARGAVDETDDAKVLELARYVEKIYLGDLYVPPIDSTGFIAAIRSELRNLYADAMVAGGAAALRLGQERTAARLANNALTANDLREDALIVLVRALRACGRSIEADQRCAAFERRVAREKRRAPSRRELDDQEEL